MKNILLIGPGSSILDYKLEENKDYTIIAFAGTFDWFVNNDTVPDYWTFFDPNSIYVLIKNLDKISSQAFLDKIKGKTTLIYNDIQGGPEFYKAGFTTSKGIKWNSNKILENFGNYFNKVEKVKTGTKVNTLEVSSEVHNIITHGRGINMCKLSSNLLTLIYHKFKDIESISTIGFGDYDLPRAYQASAKGYTGFKLSFDRMLEAHKKYLKDSNIDVKVLNKNSYYKKLEWIK